MHLLLIALIHRSGASRYKLIVRTGMGSSVDLDFVSYDKQLWDVR